MKYFRLIAKGIDCTSLMDEVVLQDTAWSLVTGRQESIPVQRHTNTIFLRNAIYRPDLHINENQESVATEAARLFPKAMLFMVDFATRMEATLSRATIVRLKPFSQVFPHVDAGSYYFIRDRYHLVLHSSSGSVLCSGNETVRMQEGEIWWFDNKQYHASFNESSDWRVHYIFDLLPNARKDMALNPLSPIGLKSVLETYGRTAKSQLA